jgi:hypothetical protein
LNGDTVVRATPDWRFDLDPSGRSALRLARLALKAEEASVALADEHRDRCGRLPRPIEGLVRQLSRLSDCLGELARRQLA